MVGGGLLLIFWARGCPFANAHWCSNIYNTHARIVVKPERQSINIGVGQSGELKVRIRNNFPYTLAHIRLASNNPPGLSVNVNPSQFAPVYAGHEVTFTLSITRNNNDSGDDVTDLRLQVSAAVMNWGNTGPWDWNNAANDYRWIVSDANLNPDAIRQRMQNPGQTYALNLHKLVDLGKVPAHNCTTCENQGMEGMTGEYTFEGLMDQCRYATSEGTWDNQPTQWRIRSCIAMGIRLRFDTFTNPNRSQVVNRLKEVMQTATLPEVRGWAAFLAAYGGSDILSDIQAVANTDSSSTAKMMAKAGLLTLGEDGYLNEVSNCVNNGGNSYEMRSACAAALGLLGEEYDAVIQDNLMPWTGDGTMGRMDWWRLTPNYMLQLLVYDRRGGPSGNLPVSFLDEDLVVDETPPKAPENLQIRTAN